VTYSPEPDKDFFTPEWRNEEVGPPPGAVVPEVVELPEIDTDPPGADPDELPDGSFAPASKNPDIFPDHTEVDPDRDPDDKPVYCWCPARRGKHNWDPSGDCPRRGPGGLAHTILTELRAIDARLSGQDPERDPETGEPIDPVPPERDDPAPLPNQSPWFPQLAKPSGYPGPLFFKEGGPMEFEEHPKQYTTGMRHYDQYAEEKTTEVQRWADVAMWPALKHDDPQHPKVTITMLYGDPLGMMAMVNGMYTGKVYRSPFEVTDAERREAWEAATVSKLSETPLEWIQMSILFENVSRAFTHQLVRTRMATYAQESMRFAVKGDVANSTKLPPSLAGTVSGKEWAARYGNVIEPPDEGREQRWRNRWDRALDSIDQAYSANVDDGMPAEDARGILPTNILTRVHDRIDMKSLLHLAGMRLCTQAQFEWREVFAQVAQSLRNLVPESHPWRWQYELMADSFRPVCFAAGHCPMQATSDRHCSIRPQVEAFATAGVPSSDWEKEKADRDNGFSDDLDPIRPEQWLADPTAARVAPGGTR
jgi:flavin-dependent thymidylate synthase